MRHPARAMDSKPYTMTGYLADIGCVRRTCLLSGVKRTSHFDSERIELG